MKRRCLLACMLFLCVLCGCSKNRKTENVTYEDVVVANDQSIAFADGGYYYCSEDSIYFMDTSGRAEEIYTNEKVLVYSLFTYGDCLYAVASRNLMNASDNGCCVYVWRKGAGEPELLFETENRVGSCLIQNGVLSYITYERSGLVVDAEKTNYDIIRNEIHRYDMETGKEEMVAVLEGNETHIINYLSFVKGSHLEDSTPVLLETFSPAGELTESDWSKNQHSIFYELNNGKLLPMMNDPLPYGCMDTCLYGDTIWFSYLSDPEEDEKGLCRYRLAKMERNGENRQDIFEVNDKIYFTGDGAYTCSQGERFKRLYYKLETGELLESKTELPKEYFIKGIDEDRDLLAYDTTDYSQFEDGAVITGDPATYCIGKKSDYFKERYEEYTGDLDDCFTVYREETE